MLDSSPTVGELIRRERIRKGLTQSALAAAAGIHVNTLAMIENRGADPTFSTVRRLAHALRCSVAQLVPPESLAA